MHTLHSAAWRTCIYWFLDHSGSFCMFYISQCISIIYNNNVLKPYSRPWISFKLLTHDLNEIGNIKLQWFHGIGRQTLWMQHLESLIYSYFAKDKECQIYLQNLFFQGYRKENWNLTWCNQAAIRGLNSRYLVHQRWWGNGDHGWYTRHKVRRISRCLGCWCACLYTLACFIH